MKFLILMKYDLAGPLEEVVAERQEVEAGHEMNGTPASDSGLPKLCYYQCGLASNHLVCDYHIELLEVNFDVKLYPDCPPVMEI